MKWIGQHIYDLVSRFRDDVYLEDISTGTIASGAHLGLDSNNKIVKAADGGGDLTSIVAGTGLSGTSLTGPIPTLNVDASQTQITSVGTIGTGVWQGTRVASAYLDTDTAHLTTDQTFTGIKTFDIDRSAAQGNAGTETIAALHVDFDRTVPTSGTHGHRDSGIDLDVTSASLGTSSLKGMNIDVVGATSGTSTATGIDLLVSGADTNIGIQVLCEGEQLRLSHNSDDYATFTVADTGDLTIATVGDGTTDSDLILDADGHIKLEPATGFCTITSAVASSASEGAKLNLISDDGAALGDDHRLGKLAFQAAEDASGTLKQGASIEAYADAAWSASENGTRLEFYTMDGNAAVEKSLTLDSDLLATFAGGVTVTGTITGDVTGDLTGQADTVATIAGLAPNTATTQATQAAITTCANLVTVGTIGTGVWNGTAIASAYIADDAVTFAKAVGVSPNVYGSIIKLLPSDFAANIDGGNTKLGVGYTDTAGSAYGMKVGSSNTELFAFVSIPEGMKATHVDVFDKDDRALEVFEVQINATSLTSKGSGNCNTTLDITDVNATATNFLAIKITTTATTDKVFGGQVTIAAQ